MSAPQREDDVLVILGDIGEERRQLGERLGRGGEPTPASVRSERDPLDAKLMGERALAKTAAEWLEDLQREAKAFPGVVVRQDTVAGTIRIAYYRGQRARYSGGQYAGEFYHYERRLPSGMWDNIDESGALALLTQAIGREND